MQQSSLPTDTNTSSAAGLSLLGVLCAGSDSENESSMIESSSTSGPISYSDPDSEEAVFQTLASTGGSSTIDDSSESLLDDPIWYWTPGFDGAVSELAESEAVRLLAARIPPELFDDILFYVNVNRVSQRYWPEGRDLKRHGEPSPNDILTDLKQCSLVCRFWASICRRHMFSDRALYIGCYDDAKIFRRYVAQGCPRLTPVCQLIREIRVCQPYKSRTSFIHLLDLPFIQDKLRNLSIEGPVPAGFSPAKLDTPHWGVPPSIIPPDSFLRKGVTINNVHLPSFCHVARYLRQLSRAAWISFDTITWDGPGMVLTSLPYGAPNTVNRRIKPHSMNITVKGVCTDSVCLALTALMMNPQCPMHRLSDEQQVWMIKFMALLWGDKEDSMVSIAFDVSEHAITMQLGPFHFVLEQVTSMDRLDSALRAVGMHAYIFSDEHSYGTLPVNFETLVDQLRAHPTIRAIVFLFDSFDRLENSLEPFVKVLSTATEAFDFVLAYEEEDDEEHRAVGVDPVTLEPSDFIWADFSMDVGWSADILRRELKKKY